VGLRLLLGKTVPTPAASNVISAIESVEVTCSDEGRDGFQISFNVEESGKEKRAKKLIIDDPLLKPFTRTIIMVSIGSVNRVLIDGFITNQEYSPGSGGQQASFRVTGEDLSLVMDREEKSDTHPNQPDFIIVGKILASYARYGIIPDVIPPVLQMVSIEVNRVPTQQGTDLKYIRALAENNDYVFFIEPTDVPGVNRAYWGPLALTGKYQKPLTNNMGSETNISEISFNQDSLKATQVVGKINEPSTGLDIPIRIISGQRPSLSSSSSDSTDNAFVQTSQFRESGLSTMEATKKAQSKTSKSTHSVTANGELSVVEYKEVLRARRLVALRGVGEAYDGIYYVKKVTHNIRRGEYTQRFTLTREGLGSSIKKVT
jgi:hypothetical protein